MQAHRSFIFPAIIAKRLWLAALADCRSVRLF
jgi:hypothetical protein